VDDPISSALRRTVQQSRDADELTARVTQSFGVGQLGRARQIADEVKGREWLYGPHVPPVLPTRNEGTGPSAGSRGWVYVLSNKAMPGLLKIGFSTKDPMDRAIELEGTGVPFAFEVEYDVLVQDPRAVEGRTHELLSQFREAKEFFRTSASDAITAIKAVIAEQGKRAFSEQRRTK
jgi:T5orf172 domain